eukprot:3544167-Pleurochrysis_carterae.AAC.2
MSRGMPRNAETACVLLHVTRTAEVQQARRRAQMRSGRCDRPGITEQRSYALQWSHARTVRRSPPRYVARGWNAWNSGNTVAPERESRAQMGRAPVGTCTGRSQSTNVGERR